MISLYVDLKRKGKFPTVASLKMPCPPNVATLETMSNLGNDLYKKQRLIRCGLERRPRMKDIGEKRQGRETDGLRCSG